MTLRADIQRQLGEIAGPENVRDNGLVLPGTAEETAAVLCLADGARLTIGPVGNGTLQDPNLEPRPDIVLSLRRMAQLKQYAPGDLTASMQAGITLDQLSAALEPHHQWLPLGVCAPGRTTIGGALAANASGPFRAFYGTGRDMVIGMRFATVEGKVIRTGGMVVKNVAGYDMAKLMIGSMGTLGVITDVNVKVVPRPPTETALLPFDSLHSAMKARDGIVRSVLTPLALDLLDRKACAHVAPELVPGSPFVLAARYGGVEAVIARHRREFEAVGQAAGAQASVILDAAADQAFWAAVCDFPVSFNAAAPDSVRVKLGGTLAAMAPLLDAVTGIGGAQIAIVARAASGISYVYATSPGLPHFCARLREAAAAAGAYAVIESAPAAVRPLLEVWGPLRDDHAMMRKLKQAFDPNSILNPGRFLC